jgi:hypothetical protein
VRGSFAQDGGAAVPFDAAQLPLESLFSQRSGVIAALADDALMILVVRVNFLASRRPLSIQKKRHARRPKDEEAHQ